MTSTAGSPPPSASAPPPPPAAVERAALVLHGTASVVAEALPRVEAAARAAGVELVEDDEAQLAVVLGGDGTMLRALTRFLDRGVPVVGVNFGRVGFLASIPRDRLEAGLARVFAGDYRVVELPTLELELDGGRHLAVNDVVTASSVLGRMVEIDWEVGGEALGRLACDGLICSTPSGSTAYNLSNGGPVLMWGLDAMALTFVAPHSLQARPLVVPPGVEVVVRNATHDVPLAVLVDGHRVGDVPPEGRASVRVGGRRSLLATLPETTFFRRYHETFSG